jgi:HSP20 family protein
MNDLTIFKPFATALDRGFNSLFDEFEKGFFDLEMPSSRILRTKIDENDNEYTLVAEVPGLKDDQLNITYENGIISVEANYGEKKEGEGFSSLRAGKFCKAYRIQDIDGENIKAELRDGVLKVSLPKAEGAKPRKIEIIKS